MAALGVSCRSGTLPSFESAFAASVPAGATILAGVNLDRVRASPLHRQLPPASLALLESLGGARSVLVTSDGNNYLVLTSGDFKQAPSGTTLLGQGLAAVGSPGWLREAAARHGHGTAANGLLARAMPIAAADIWIAVAGAANLPVSGNGENLNRLLHQTEYSTLTVRLVENVTIDVMGMCRSPELALHLEETVRAIVSMAAAGTARQPAVSGLLRRIRVTRDGRAVHLTLEADASGLETILRLFSIGS